MAFFNAPVSGLFTSPNPFSQAPQGSLARADNVRFTAPGVLAPRPGFPKLNNSAFGSASSRATTIGFFEASTLIHYDDSKVSAKASLAAAFVDLTGTFNAASGRMRFVGAARSTFWNADDGVWMWDGVGQPRAAGNPQGLDQTGYYVSTNGWQDSDTAVAYRYTLCSVDAFGRVIEGPPSGRRIFRNIIQTAIGSLSRTANVVTADCGAVPHFLSVGDVVTMSPVDGTFAAGAKTVVAVLNLYLFTYAEVAANAVSTVVHTFAITRSIAILLEFHATATTATFLRVYRSEMTALAADNPSDELWQVYETAFLTAGQIAAGFIAITDTTPESILEVPLYTNANTGEGALQGNYQPPIAEDMAYFASRMWFANTTNKHSLEIALIGVGSPDGIQNNDTITIAGTTYTGSTSSGGPSPVFFIWTTFDAPTNIRLTALTIINAINNNAQVDVYAYYASAENGFPGRILIQARTLGAGAFIAKASRGASWNPRLPVTTEFVVSSDNNRHAAGLFYSKLGQPEAVPPGNYLPVEADNQEILRIHPLNHQLIIFKTNGVYICNDTAPFSIQKISECRLIAPDSVDLLGSALYALTDQGIVRVTDSGVEPISIPIDDAITPLFGAVLDNLRERSVAIGHESARQYLCWMPEDEGVADYASNAYVFSTLAGGFTRYPFGVRGAGLNEETDQLYLAPTDGNYLLAEAKTYTDEDYRDLAYSVTVSSQAADVLTLVSVAAVTVGDALVDASAVPWLVIAVDSAASTVTTLGTGSFAAGTYTGYEGIACDVQFNKVTGGAPATMKNWQQVSILARRNTLRGMDVSFATEVSTSETTVELTNPSWGESEWGEQPWGDPSAQVRRIEPLPLEDSNACQMQVGFQARQALASFEILGLVLVSEKDGEANRG